MNRFLSVILLFFFISSLVTAEDLYFPPQNVEIKQKDVDSASAKKKALEEASRFAFKNLLSDELKCDPNSIDNISDQQISDCIYDYSIENEKYSDLFYIAELSYRFDKKSVLSLLHNIDPQHNQKSYTEEQSKTSEKIKVLVRTVDFLTHLHKLNNLEYKIEIFSKEKVIFVLNKKHFDEIKKIHMDYILLL